MIEVKHLTKVYGNNTAVDDLTFTVEEGKIYGFLGPNGAGKSTTMNIITGCLSATKGDVSIGGYDIFEDAEKARALIGFLPEHPPLYLDMTPEEYLYFVSEAKGVPKNRRKEDVEHAISVTKLDHMRHRLCKNLSKGYRQRVGIAQSILGDPQVIILDEPTVGLDPLQIIEIRELIRELGKKHTVILSSHILSEVRSVCDRVLIIANGRLVADDTPDNLENLLTGQHTVTMQLKAAEQDVRAALADVTGIVSLSCSENNGITEAVLNVKSDEDVREQVFYACAAAKCPILGMTHNQLSLEDIFIELVAAEKADKAAQDNISEEVNVDDSNI